MRRFETLAARLIALLAVWFAVVLLYYPAQCCGDETAWTEVMADEEVSWVGLNTTMLVVVRASGLVQTLSLDRGTIKDVARLAGYQARWTHVGLFGTAERPELVAWQIVFGATGTGEDKQWRFDVYDLLDGRTPLTRFVPYVRMPIVPMNCPIWCVQPRKRQLVIWQDMRLFRVPLVAGGTATSVVAPVSSVVASPERTEPLTLFGGGEAIAGVDKRTASIVAWEAGTGKLLFRHLHADPGSGLDAYTISDPTAVHGLVYSVDTDPALPAEKDGNFHCLMPDGREAWALRGFSTGALLAVSTDMRRRLLLNKAKGEVWLYKDEAAPVALAQGLADDADALEAHIASDGRTAVLLPGLDMDLSVPDVGRWWRRAHWVLVLDLEKGVTAARYQLDKGREDSAPGASGSSPHKDENQ